MTFPQTGDEVIYNAYLDYQEMCGPDGENRYPHYWSYVQDQVENYRHLMREEDTPENREFLDRLEEEIRRHENLEPMRPQAVDDPEEQGVTVNVRVWVAAHIDNPIQMIRDLLHESDDTPWLSVLETWIDDPE